MAAGKKEKVWICLMHINLLCNICTMGTVVYKQIAGPGSKDSGPKRKGRVKMDK